MLRTIKLYGELGKKFGRVHKAHVESVAEAIKYFCANFKDFRQHLIDSETRIAGYEVWDGKYNVSESKEDIHKHGTQEIRIIPRINGSGAAGRIIAGVVLLVVAYFLGSSEIARVGIALIVGGVAELLSPKPHTSSDSSTDTNNSYIFSGATNSTKQGNPVAIGYGKMLVGSQVISASITTQDIPV